MTNLFFNHTNTLSEHTLAKGSDINTIAQAVEAGFDKLPTENNLKRGTATYQGTDTGSANAYVIDMPDATNPTGSYPDGFSGTIKVANSNTGPSTLNINTIGAAAWKRQDGSALVSGDVVASRIYGWEYNATAGYFVLLNPEGVVNGATVQAGYAKEWATKAEDSLISTAAGGDGATDYSALHHAAKASASATAASTSASSASTDAAAAAASALSAASSASSGLYINQLRISSVDSPFSVTNAHEGYLIIVDTSGGAVTINLPDLSLESADFRCGINKETSDANAVTVQRQGTDTIDGATSYAMSVQNNLTSFMGDQSAGKYVVSDARKGLGSAATANTGTGEANVPTMADLKPYLGRNYVIDGGFNVWLEGTTQTTSGYGSDTMWGNVHSGSTKTHSAQAFILGQTDVPGEPKYFSRTVVTSAAGAANYVKKYQKIEGVRRCAGKVQTLTFYAKADAAKNIAVEAFQHFGTGGAPSADVSAISVATVALMTGWIKHTVTITWPSISGKTLGANGDDYGMVAFWFDAGSNYNSNTNSLGQQSGTFDIANVQLEDGMVATDFEVEHIRVTETKCMRYFVSQSGGEYCTGGVYTTNAHLSRPHQYPCPMRVTPTLSITTGSSGGVGAVATAGNNQYGFTSYASASAANTAAFYDITYTADARL